MALIEHLSELLEEARRYNERRLIVLEGKREKSYEIIKKFIPNLDGKIAYLSYIPEKLSGIETYHLKDSEKLLGTTYDHLILDTCHSFQPSDLGKLYGVVKGGGLIFLITPQFEEWKKMLNRYHYHILTPPYKEEDIRKNFIKWFIEKLWRHDGIAIIEDENILKKGNYKSKIMIRKKIKIPNDIKFRKEIYSIALTQDQIDFIKIGEKMLDDGAIIVLKANRGRGKSSAIGILLAGIIEKIRGRVKMLIIAPERRNVDEIFRFIERGLTILKIGYKKIGNSIITENATLKYMEPFDAYNEEADFIIVDEAAAIPPHILIKYLENSERVIYSSTVHGYEGAGRSFTIRFLKRLREMKKNFVEFEMEEPIRYSINDPVEKWVFDTLLLDAEPSRIESIDLNRIEYEKIDMDKVLEEEDKIREFFGILIMAHYRNNPNDFAILCDGPNQMARALLQDGKIVCSMQIAMEGGLGRKDCNDTYFKSIMMPGNIIPQVLIRHYRRRKYGKYRGIRIVRIATHPDHFGKGIGTLAVKMIEKEARQMGLDYIGVSFGATIPLLNFWLKNGFIPVHITPTVNRISGENSVIVIKPLSKKFREEIEKIRKEFLKRLMIWLIEPLRDFNSTISLMLIDSYHGDSRNLNLDENDLKRISAYLWDGLTYKTVKDSLFNLTYNLFLSHYKNILTKREKLLLLTKNLQCKNWKRVSAIVKCEKCEEEFKNAVEKIIKHVYGDRNEIIKFQEEVSGNAEKRR